MAVYGIGAATRMRGHRECNCKTRSSSRRVGALGVTCELRRGRDSAVSPFSDAASIYYTPSEIERRRKIF